MALSDNLQGWWCPSLDAAGNGTTTLTDLSGNGNNGTLTNMDAATDWVTDTDSGGVRALDFDGPNTTERVEIPFVLNPGAGDFSVFAWVLSNNYGIGLAALQQIGTGRSWLYQDTTVLLTFITGAAKSIGNYTLGQWYHVGFTMSGTTFRTYFNGVLQSTSSGTAESHTGGLYLGSHKVPNQVWNGLIDGTAIWNRAITAEEVTQLYNGGRSFNLLSTGTIQSIVPQLLLRRRRLSGGLVI